MADVSPSAANDALRRPSAFTGDPAGLQRNLASAGAEAQSTLSAVVTGPGNTAADRVAAAVILAARFDDASGLNAIGSEETGDPEVLGLRWSEDLRAKARTAVGQSVIVSLLTWASTATPAEPPLAAARAAAELGVDDDGAIFQKVSQRAVQLAQQRGTSRARKDELRQFTESLGRADQRARQSRATSAPGAAEASSPGAAEASTPLSPNTPPDAHPADGPSPEASSGPAPRAGPDPAEAERPPSSSSGDDHPEHASDAQPSQWSARDDHALNDLLGHGSPGKPAANQPPEPRDDPDHGKPVGFGDAPAGGTPAAGNDQDAGASGPPDEPRYGDRFEDKQWSGDTDETQDPPGPGPRRAYDPRALFDGPMSPTQKADEKNVLRNWAITAAVLVGILILVGLLI
ncbi:hypothetical protein FCK90_12875 [Kocuria coralli]|uniref:Uncharacterized protein n=1 Tax=Kocuria coralli TaxID=1461025 RepID=A0A5J5KWS5_9MICC|nr:hypothetical protein [Kocuria coralli]KAA9393276.1 hypothetical protein FCK90_12875 [Kocuria coralli]